MLPHSLVSALCVERVLRYYGEVPDWQKGCYMAENGVHGGNGKCHARECCSERANHRYKAEYQCHVGV